MENLQADKAAADNAVHTTSTHPGRGTANRVRRRYREGVHAPDADARRPWKLHAARSTVLRALAGLASIVLLTLGLTFTSAQPARANTLNAGAIVVVGLDAGINTVTLAVLDDLSAGMQVWITDKGWNTLTSSFTSSSTGDGEVLWHLSGSVSKGTVLRLSLPTATNAPTLTNMTLSQDLSADLFPSVYTVSDPIPLSGDQIFVFQDGTSNPYFLNGLNNSAGTVDASNWNTSITATLRDSMLPDGAGSQNALTPGVNAIGLPGGASQKDNVAYTGPTSTTDRATWLARFMNNANWSGDDFGPPLLSIGSQFFITQPSTITTVSYDGTTGELTVNGTNIAQSDTIAWSQISVTGEGGSTHTLTTADSSFDAASPLRKTLSSSDREALSGILNKAGNSSTTGTTYNVSAGSGWNTTAGSAVGGSTIPMTVTPVPVPQVTSATYDAMSGALTVATTGVSKRSGPSNDIVAANFTIVGVGASTYTLTDTPNVERTSSTAFMLVLSATDRSEVNLLWDRNGTRSSDNVTYNVAASEGWSAGADSAVSVADLSGNAVTVSGAEPPTTTSTSTSTSTTTTVEPTTSTSTSTSTTTTVEPTTSTSTSTSTTTTVEPTTSTSTSTSTTTTVEPTTSTSTSTSTTTTVEPTTSSTSTSSPSSSTTLPSTTVSSSLPGTVPTTSSTTQTTVSLVPDSLAGATSTLPATSLASVATPASSPPNTVGTSATAPGPILASPFVVSPPPIVGAVLPSPMTKAGSVVEVSGSGFLSSSTARIELRSTPVHLGDVVVDADGAFRTSVQIPVGTVGNHHIVVIGTAPDGAEHTISIPLAVETPAAITQDLALTGMRSTDLAVRAASLLGAGLLLLFAVRRRQTSLF